jgi:hypothetical protein
MGIYAYVLFNDTASSSYSYYISPDYRIVNSELQCMWKVAVVAQFKYYPRI